MDWIKHDNESESEPDQRPKKWRTDLSHGEPESIGESAKEERRKLS